MKERLVGLVKTYVLLVCVFVLQKPLFMAFYYMLYEDCKWLDWLKVMWHGLPFDLILAGYLTVIPGLLYLISVWTLSRVLHRIWCAYFLLVSIGVSLIFVGDFVLYKYSGICVEAYNPSHFFSSLCDTVTAPGSGLMMWGIGIVCLYAALLYWAFYAVLLKKTSLLHMKLPYQRLQVSGVLLLAVCVLVVLVQFILAVPAMQDGKIHFSTEQRLNHAATNPVYSLIESFVCQKEEDGGDNG